MAAWLFLLATAIGMAFTVNAFVPLRGNRRFFLPSFFASWLTIELAGHHLVWQAIATLAFLHFGALASWPGWVGLGLVAVQWVGLVALLLQGHRARHTMADALAGFAPTSTEHRIRWWRLLIPFPLRIAHTRRIRDVVYGRAAGRHLKLDIYLPEQRSEKRPAIVQVHGGAWVIGDKGDQGIPLLMHLADRGWVGFNVNYRLSPGATFPDHLVDIKRAIAWIRAHADEYGVDPEFIAITGGSAGGHLSAMAALTSDDPAYQPGFETADTHVDACVPIYGVYDFVDRLGLRRKRYRDGFIGPYVLKAFYDDEPAAFHRASPVDRVNADAPPFLVVHGDRDTMAPLQDARMFVERLREVSASPVLFAEIRGAQHAFDLFLSPRSVPVIEGVADFLDEVRRRALTARHERLASEATAPYGAMFCERAPLAAGAGASE